MLQIPTLLFAVLFSVYVPSRSMECLLPRGALPTVRDCQDLTDAIAYLARFPGENNPKTWGRRLPSTTDTQNLPKIYWIVGRGPTTCAVHVDVNADDVFAIDTFRLSTVGLAAERVVSRCLVGERKIGLEYPSGGQHVYAKLVRTDAPFFLDLLDDSDVQSVLLLNGRGVLHSATVNHMGAAGGASNGSLRNIP